MKIGMVYNPAAGNKSFQREAILKIVPQLEGNELFCTTGSYAFLKRAFPGINCIGATVYDSYLDSVNAGMLLNAVDLVVVFGGDGTCADVVSGQRAVGRLVPVVGIGCGTANAGPLVFTDTLDDLEKLSPGELSAVGVAGIDVYDEKDRLVGTAFNDLVMSDCLVSTMEDRVITAEARAFLFGEKRSKAPSKIFTAQTRISINHVEMEFPFEIAQIILSPIYDKEQFAFRAVFGKICWLPYSDKSAAMIVAAEPVICITGKDDFNAVAPLHLSQFILGNGDEVEISGTKGFAIVDGNPRIDMEEIGALTKAVFNSFAAKTVRRL